MELMLEPQLSFHPVLTEPIKMQANMMNILTIGSDKNYVWHSMQVNVSPAKASEKVHIRYITRACLIILIRGTSS